MVVILNLSAFFFGLSVPSTFGGWFSCTRFSQNSFLVVFVLREYVFLGSFLVIFLSSALHFLSKRTERLREGEMEREGEKERGSTSSSVLSEVF